MRSPVLTSSLHSRSGSKQLCLSADSHPALGSLGRFSRSSSDWPRLKEGLPARGCRKSLRPSRVSPGRWSSKECIWLVHGGSVCGLEGCVFSVGVVTLSTMMRGPVLLDSRTCSERCEPQASPSVPCWKSPKDHGMRLSVAGRTDGQIELFNLACCIGESGRCR